MRPDEQVVCADTALPLCALRSLRQGTGSGLSGRVRAEQDRSCWPELEREAIYNAAAPRTCHVLYGGRHSPCIEADSDAKRHRVPNPHRF